MSSPLMHFAKIFSPSWKFFDKLGTIPRLHYHTQIDPQWRALPELSKPKWYAIFINTRTNLHHARSTLLENFVAELTTSSIPPPEHIPSMVSYRLIQKIVAQELDSQARQVELHHEPTAASPPSTSTRSSVRRFQFRICVRRVQHAQASEDDLLISEWHDY